MKILQGLTADLISICQENVNLYTADEIKNTGLFSIRAIKLFGNLNSNAL